MLGFFQKRESGGDLGGTLTCILYCGFTLNSSDEGNCPESFGSPDRIIPIGACY